MWIYHGTNTKLWGWTMLNQTLYPHNMLSSKPATIIHDHSLSFILIHYHSFSLVQPPSIHHISPPIFPAFSQQKNPMAFFPWLSTGPPGCIPTPWTRPPRAGTDPRRPRGSNRSAVGTQRPDTAPGDGKCSKNAA